MTEIEVPDAPGTLPTYLAVPSGDGPWPGVVIVHDVFGMTDDLRRQADRLAAKGFVAAAPDLFHSGAKVTCVRSAFKDLRARRGRIFDEVEAVRSWLCADGRCTGRVGVIGFCLGGGFALLMAAGRGFGVSSVNYGDVPDDADRILEGACPVVASYGGRDRRLRGAADRLESALAAAGVPHDVKVYPTAGHGFMNDHHTLVLKVFGPIMGVGYDDAAAKDAQGRVVAFFDHHLRT